jgi:hypothetical protein
MRRYVGDALFVDRGRVRATAADRLYRPLFVYSGGRRVDVDVRGSRKASLVGAYHGAVRRYLATGEQEELRPFVGRTVAGVELEADPEVIEDIAHRGGFDFDSIYRMVV